jgi:hypothetical protein
MLIKVGHYLQVCPTNMDPAYDRPPDNSYTCRICGARGKHFNSLCPENIDSHSIIQKRKASGIKTQSKLQMAPINNWKMDIDNEAEGTGMDWEQGRLSRETSEISGTSSSPAFKKAQALEKLHEIDELKVRLARGDSVDLAEVIGVMTDYPISKTERDIDSTLSDLDGMSIDSMSHDDLDIEPASSSNKDIDDNIQSRDNNPVKVYSEFVQRLIGRHEEMKEVVSPARRRQTALDSWD